MNFNLASPSNDGNNFTIQFKEQLSIPANSKVKLNFAELVRDKEVILDTDATIKMDIAPADMIPTAPPANNAADNLAFDNQSSSSKTATINKGDYTFIAFRDAVEDALVTLLAASNLKTYEVYVDNNDNEAVLTIGIMPETTDTTSLKAFEFDATHAHDASTGGGTVAYTTANVTSSYDNYALANTHYYHYIDNATLGVKNTEGENQDITSKNNAYIYCRSIKTVAAQSGQLWVGLYSKEYADGIGGAPPARITGNNPPTLSATGNKPCTFVGVEFHDTDGLNIYYAEDNAGNLITTWDDINRAIVDMKVVARIPPTQFEQTKNWDILIGTEIDNTKDTPSIRVKVANYQDGVFNLLWDSQPVNKNLPFKLMVGDVTTYDNATALNSQIPFNWLASVSTAATDNGFVDLEYKQFDKALGSNANPVSLAKKITLTLSSNAARAVGLRESLVIRPNQFTEANKNAIIADLNYTWKKNNYSILLDLPLNNYKNKQASARTAAAASVKKQVLANIPAAFSIGETTESIQPQLGNSEVITVYQPYNVIQSRLDNNPIEINSMSFRIVDMLTEELAKEIKRSVINFTIEPPEKM
jgi:hypothetical protein